MVLVSCREECFPRLVFFVVGVTSNDAGNNEKHPTKGCDRQYQQYIMKQFTCKFAIWGATTIAIASVIIFAPRIAGAYQFTVPPTIPAPYTDVIMGCGNFTTVVNGRCAAWYVVFFNSSTQMMHDGVWSSVGSGDLITDDTTFDPVTQGFTVQLDGEVLYSECTSSFSCASEHLSSGGAFGVSGLADFQYWFYSSRSIRDENGSLLYSAGTIPELGEPTQFYDISVDIDAAEVTVTGYIDPSDLSSDDIELKMIVSMPGFSVWNQESYFATTSGVFSWTSFYPSVEASTTIPEFTFKATMQSVDNSNAYAPLVTLYKEISTSTTPLGWVNTSNPANVVNGIVENCTPWSNYWSVSLCLTYLFRPDPNQIEANMTELRDKFLTRVPMGYVTRFIDILNSTTTVALPGLVITVPGASQSLDLTPWDQLMGEGSLLDNASSSIRLAGVTYGSGRTFREITEPYWEIIWYVLLAFGIVHDLIGFGRSRVNAFGKSGSLSDSGSNDDSYRLKEWLYSRRINGDGLHR